MIEKDKGETIKSYHFEFLPLSSPLMKSEEELQLIIGDYERSLHQLGGERINHAGSSHSSLLFLLIATGGTEGQVKELCKKEERKPGSSVVLLAHPNHNSLPAALESLAWLHQAGINGKIIYMEHPEHDSALHEIRMTVKHAEVWSFFKRARIGIVGTPSDWLIASCPNPKVISDKWGLEVIPLVLGNLPKLMEQYSREEIEPTLNSFVSRAKEVAEASHQDLENGVRVYLALKEILKENRLDALTIRCFDLVVDHQTTGCFALSQLLDEGVIAGCEGDIVSTIGMVLSKELLDEIPWMANPAQLCSHENTLWLAHCTVPKTLIDSYKIRSHFESGLGVGIEGHFPQGPVTLMRLGGSQLEEIWLAEGSITQSGNSEQLCRTQVKVELERGHVNSLLSNPLGNHLILVKGHHMDQLQGWWNVFINIDQI